MAGDWQGWGLAGGRLAVRGGLPAWASGLWMDPSWVVGSQKLCKQSCP